MAHISMHFSHLTYNWLTFEMTGQIIYTFFIAYVNIGIEHLISHGDIIEWYFKTLIK